MKCVLEVLNRWFHAWKTDKIAHKNDLHKLMAGIAELTTAIADNTTALTAVATAIDNAIAKGIGGTAPDLQPAVDAITANTTALKTATDKLVAATPV